MTFHVWLNDVAVLILFVRVSRLMTYTCCESKLCDAVESICGNNGLSFIWLSRLIVIILFWKRISYHFVILKNIWVKSLRVSTSSLRSKRGCFNRFVL
jgi:hypothetical protein